MFDVLRSTQPGRCLPVLLDVAVKSLTVSAAALAALLFLRRPRPPRATSSCWPGWASCSAFPR